MSDHHHDHDHDHENAHDRPLSGPALRVKALESLLVEKGLIDPKTLDEIVDTYEHRVGPRNGARVVANPGCYATSILVALAPLAKAGLIAPGGTVHIAAASGVSGAGASPKLELLFAEVTENFRPYGVGNSHRHLFEMRASLAALGADCDLLFTPHLLPIDRGILSTITVPLTRPIDEALAPYRDLYANEPFVELTDELPALADVQHRNVVRIGARIPSGVRTPTLLVFSAIDNLVKGAAGQAIQNANLMLGFDETAGLMR